MEMVIFLDIDGVLNNKRLLTNNTVNFDIQCVKTFNKLLNTFPEAKIVISSSWRYMILDNQMTLRGFEYMLITHGVDCHNRVIGHTESDSYRLGRGEQIKKWAKENNVFKFIAIDDTNLNIKEQVKTSFDDGFTETELELAIDKLSEI